MLSFTTICLCWGKKETCIYTLLATPSEDEHFILQPFKFIHEMFHYLAIQLIKLTSNIKMIFGNIANMRTKPLCIINVTSMHKMR